MRRSLAAISVALWLSACGGGGGGGETTTPRDVPDPGEPTPQTPLPEQPEPRESDPEPSEPTPDPEDPGDPGDPDDPDPGTPAEPAPDPLSEFETPEYFRAGGLSQINAAEGYAIRVTGEAGGAGQRIAIIDSGVDTHPELAIADRFALEGVDFGDPGPHGTHVAGIAAAKRNGQGVHGVAFNSEIVSLKIAPTDFASERILEEPAAIAAAIASAAGVERTFVGPDGQEFTSSGVAESDVINMSFTTGDFRREVRRAMRIAAERGKILVAALGNDDLSTPVAAPASYVIADGIRGMALAVGALDADGNDKASFSNSCGDVAEFCLFAPGVDIVSTLPGDDLGTLSGTSMAAPHVAGAAAVLQSAFPSQEPAAIVNRLLTTSDDLGAPGVDSVFGHGRLNLERAMQPVGTTSVPMTNSTRGGSLAVADAEFTLPSWANERAFEAALAEVLVQDEQGFPFLADLSSKVRRNTSRSDVATFTSQRQVTAAGLGGSAGTQLQLWQSRRDNELATYESWQARGLPASVASTDFNLDLPLTSSTRISLASSQSHRALSAGLLPTSGRADSVASLAELYHPALLNDDGHAVAFQARLAPKLDGAWIVSRSENGDTQAAHLRLSYNLNDRLALLASTGVVDEDEGVWGMEADDGTGGMRARSLQMLLGARQSLANDVAIFGGLSMSEAIDQGAAGDGLVSDIDASTALGYLAGISKRGVVADDQLAFAVSQPFRPERVNAQLDLPSAVATDGTVVRTTRSANLSPTGRETRIRLSYGRQHENLDLLWSVTGFVRLEPDHDSQAEPDVGLGVRMSWTY